MFELIVKPLLVLSIAVDITRLISREEAGDISRVDASGELYRLYSRWVRNAAT